MTRRKAEILNHYYDSLADEEELTTQTDYKFSKKPLSLNPLILILSVMLLVVAALLCYCIFYVPTKYGISASQYMNEILSIVFS